MNVEQARKKQREGGHSDKKRKRTTDFPKKLNRLISMVKISSGPNDAARRKNLYNRAMKIIRSSDYETCINAVRISKAYTKYYIVEKFHHSVVIIFKSSAIVKSCA